MVAAGGDPLLDLGLPVAVLSNVETTVATFTAPAAGSYLLQANIGVKYVSANPVLAAGLLATANCYWANNPTLELGQSVTLGVSVLVVTVPGADTGNIALPGSFTATAAGQTVNLICGAEQVLSVGSVVELTGAITAIQVQFVS